MSSALRSTVDRLRRQALAAPHHVFEKGRLRQPALAAHPDVESVLAALANERQDTYPERDALTRALLAEHQASSNPLWASILLVAYYPMLGRLRYRLVGNPLPGDELDQVVVMAFLTTLAEFPLAERSDRVAMRLRQRTQRQVFQHLHKEREQQHQAVPEDADDDFPGRHAAPEQPTASSADEKMVDLALLLQRAAKAGFSRRSLEVVSATVLKRELLRNYVARIAPQDEREHQRLYQRLKRQRTRTLRRLQMLLAAVAGPKPSSVVGGDSARRDAPSS